MEIALVVNLSNHTTLLQQIVGDLSADRLAMVVEHDFQVLSLHGHEQVRIQLCP